MNRIILFTCALLLIIANSYAQLVRQIMTIPDKSWQVFDGLSIHTEARKDLPDITINPDQTYQSINGFGGSFNEFGWLANFTPGNEIVIVCSCNKDVEEEISFEGGYNILSVKLQSRSFNKILTQ